MVLPARSNQPMCPISVDQSEPSWSAYLYTAPHEEELRDRVYKYALVQPAFWYRRHHRACPIRDVHSGDERPVFDCMRTRSEHERWHRLSCTSSDYCECEMNDADCRSCRRLCQGRPGLGLLRTCHQLYKEGSKVYWEGNMICFQELDDLVRDLRKLRQSTLDRILKLSLLEPGRM